MRAITYKYNIGDTVKLKDTHSILASCGVKEMAGKIAEITERRDYNGPCYRFAGYEGFWQESRIAERAEVTIEGPYTEEEVKAGTNPSSTPECDTGSQTAPDSKWYRISFSAKLTEADLRAMNKYFFDAMNESMEIYDLANLAIEEA
jgi:hypothetical protein